MHGFHHPSSYSHDRFPPGTGFDRYLHHDSTPREPYHLERRSSEPMPTLRSPYGLQRQATVSSISSHFDYSHTVPLSQSAGLRRDTTVAIDSVTSLRPIAEFDPRPPHAGWTPKEEVDEEVHSRELLNNSGYGEARSPGDLQSGYGVSLIYRINENSNAHYSS